jgi:hypothetical protein
MTTSDNTYSVPASLKSFVQKACSVCWRGALFRCDHPRDVGVPYCQYLLDKSQEADRRR